MPPDLAGPTDEQVARWLNPERLHFQGGDKPFSAWHGPA